MTQSALLPKMKLRRQKLVSEWMVGAVDIASSDPSADPDINFLWRTYRCLRLLASPRTRL